MGRTRAICLAAAFLVLSPAVASASDGSGGGSNDWEIVDSGATNGASNEVAPGIVQVDLGGNAVPPQQPAAQQQPSGQPQQPSGQPQAGAPQNPGTTYVGGPWAPALPGAS